jgi:hypothetical protein
MSKKVIISFKYNKIDTEKIRECLEDNLGIEVLYIDEINKGFKYE